MNRFTADDIAAAQKRWGDSLKKQLRVPPPSRLWNKFRSWCKTSNLDPDRQTMGGKRFKQFLADMEQRAQHSINRVDQVSHLFRVVYTFPQDPDGRLEEAERDGWNQCLIDYIKQGKPIGSPKMPIDYIPYCSDAWIEGYQAACRKLQELRQTAQKFKRLTRKQYFEEM